MDPSELELLSVLTVLTEIRFESVGGPLETNSQDLAIASTGEKGAVSTKSPREPCGSPPPKVSPVTTGISPDNFLLDIM